MTQACLGDEDEGSSLLVRLRGRVMSVKSKYQRMPSGITVPDIFPPEKTFYNTVWVTRRTKKNVTVVKYRWLKEASCQRV